MEHGERRCLEKKKENKPGTRTESMLAKQSRWAWEKRGIQADMKKENPKPALRTQQEEQRP